MIQKILITGGIGSGKSEVSKVLKKYGYKVYDADQFARDVLFQEELQNKINVLFQENVFLKKGHLNRDLIRKKIFENPQLKLEFENMIHPAIAILFEEKIQKITQVLDNIWVFYEASLVLEKGRQNFFDAIILVRSDKVTKKKRLIKNRGLDDAQIEQMMSSQMSDEEKSKFANFTIENDEKTTMEQLESSVYDILQKLKLFFKSQSLQIQTDG